MRAFLVVLTAISIVACVSATEVRNPYCWYPGDTIAMLGPYRDGSGTWRCTFLTSDKLSCVPWTEGKKLGRMTASDCILPSNDY